MQANCQLSNKMLLQCTAFSRFMRTKPKAGFDFESSGQWGDTDLTVVVACRHMSEQHVCIHVHLVALQHHVVELLVLLLLLLLLPVVPMLLACFC